MVQVPYFPAELGVLRRRRPSPLPLARRVGSLHVLLRLHVPPRGLHRLDLIQGDALAVNARTCGWVVGYGDADAAQSVVNVITLLPTREVFARPGAPRSIHETVRLRTTRRRVNVDGGAAQGSGSGSGSPLVGSRPCLSSATGPGLRLFPSPGASAGTTVETAFGRVTTECLRIEVVLDDDLPRAAPMAAQGVARDARDAANISLLRQFRRDVPRQFSAKEALRRRGAVPPSDARAQALPGVRRAS